MPSSEKVTARKGRGRSAAAEQSAAELEAHGSAPATGKVMAAFRIPRHLHSTMTQESRAEGIDLTAYVNRLFDGSSTTSACRASSARTLSGTARRSG